MQIKHSNAENGVIEFSGVLLWHEAFAIVARRDSQVWVLLAEEVREQSGEPECPHLSTIKDAGYVAEWLMEHSETRASERAAERIRAIANMHEEFRQHREFDDMWTEEQWLDDAGKSLIPVLAESLRRCTYF